jgi:predicted nucleic acid-binding protein
MSSMRATVVDLYLDSNVFLFAALDTGKTGDDAKALLKRVSDGSIKAAISPLVLDEVMWGVQKIMGREYSNRYVAGIISTPFTWLDIAFSCVEIARSYYKQGLNPRDAFHAAVMTDYGINVIVSEDAHFDKIKDLKRISIKEAFKGN